MKKISLRNTLERKYQEALIQYVHNRYPQVVMYANWNEGISGSKGPVYGAIRKRMGVVSGIPDLFLAHPGAKNKRGLYIEMKQPKGKVTDNQKTMMAYLEQYYEVAVCYSLEEAVTTVDCYMGKL